MTEPTAPEPLTPAEKSPPRRKGPPMWGVVAFLVLLGGLAFVSHLASTGGTPIQWIDDDLDAALKQAREHKQRVFLYLYEPDDPTHRRNELRVFSQRWARQPLKNAVSCRIALGKGDLHRVRYRSNDPSLFLEEALFFVHRTVKYRYNDTPLFLLLDANGKEMGRTEGAVDDRQFLTYIGRPIQEFAERSR